jgi:hypothetical protein
MNKHYRDNLEFLMAATPEVLEDWYDKMDDDDIAYAFELLEAYQVELETQKLALMLIDKKDVIVGPISTVLH